MLMAIMRLQFPFALAAGRAWADDAARAQPSSQVPDDEPERHRFGFPWACEPFNGATANHAAILQNSGRRASGEDDRAGSRGHSPAAPPQPESRWRAAARR